MFNWQIFFAYVGSTAAVVGLILGIAGFLVKKWMANVEETMKEVSKALHNVDVSLALLPSQYVTKEEFNKEKLHNSSKREAIWKHYNRISTRTTVLETLVGVTNKYRSKVCELDEKNKEGE